MEDIDERGGVVEFCGTSVEFGIGMRETDRGSHLCILYWEAETIEDFVREEYGNSCSTKRTYREV